MIHLIDKDALVAEIEEWLTEVEKLSRSKEARDEYGKGYCNGRKGSYRKILHVINTLEVREVDLEEEIKEVQRDYKTIEEYEGYPCTMYANGIEWISRHFFELGLKASNPLTWEDVDCILDVTDQMANDDSMEEWLKAMSQEEYCTEVLRRFKAQKGE